MRIIWTFEIYRDRASDFRWRLRAPNREIIADSAEGYSDRSGARRAAENVRSRISQAGLEEL